MLGMRCNPCANRSIPCKVAMAVGLAVLCTAVALGVIFRADVARIAKKFSALYVDGPLKIQLPLIAASAAIVTYILLCSISCCRRKPPTSKVLTNPKYTDSYPVK